MTKSEVEGILESPPGDYTTRPGIQIRPVCGMLGLPKQHDHEPTGWLADEFQVFVWFDAEERIEDMESDDWPRSSKSFLDRIHHEFWCRWRLLNGP
jgi:hypothetical protein